MTSDDDDRPDAAHRRPSGISDETVAAVGKLTEALEIVEQARGMLCGFHRLTGKADLTLDEACALLREAGHPAIADEIGERLIGRNVIEGRWTFQIIEDYDSGYHSLFTELEKKTRDGLVEGKRHLFEAEMKEERRTQGEAGHEATP